MSSARHHAEWLSLVEVSGPFLSLPVLEATFPQGLEFADQAEAVRRLRLAYDEWQQSQERRYDPAIHREWVRFVLMELLQWPADLLTEGQVLPPDLKASMLEYHETLRPDLALLTPTGRTEAGQARLLVQVYPPEQDLEKDLAKERRWKASPATRMMELLHACGVRLGLVTNGERWMLVNAPRGDTTGFVSWYAEVWLEERITLQAFRSALCTRRFFGVPDGETLEALLKESAENQAEVTDRLGEQVRRAVEVLIQTVDRIDKERGRTLLAGVNEQELYNAALTVMMRLVFLFCAEERGLLLRGEPLYDQYYAVSTLGTQLREVADQHGEEVLERRHDAWSRLLATFRAVYGGVEHEMMRLPAYGGHLFDPDRYPFLEGRAARTHWREMPAQPLPVDNRTVLHLLEALQLLEMKTASGGAMEKQRLSFRALDIEQIGHVYEGLLDHTARRAEGPVLGLEGRRENVTEVPLADLEAEASKDILGLLTLLAERTGRAQSAIKRRLEARLTLDEAAKLRVACDNNEALIERVLPYAGLLRLNTFGYPVVIVPGSVYVTAGEDRRSSGTHYTPRSLTEPLVQHTLDPLVYLGPAEGLPREQWIRQDAGHILGLKVCDLAMGSGAFLVQAARYLSARLLEAWEAAEAGYRQEGRTEPQITPEGALSSGDPQELLVPKDADERRAVALRLVCDRCLYGVDKNPMAVEMAKLSLWLTTLAKDKPFTFLDHTLRWGDSLLGADEEQLHTWSLRRDEVHQMRWFEHLMRQALDTALKLRREIANKLVTDVRDAEEKERKLAEAQEAVALLKLGCDLLAAAEMASSPRERARLRGDFLPRYTLVAEALREEREAPLREATQRGAREEWQKLREEADRRLGIRRPFHWWLEFPEVFHAEKQPGDDSVFEESLAVLDAEGAGLVSPTGEGPEQPAPKHFTLGFHAIVGNPPFMGGKKITGALSDEYREYLVEILANGQRGHADLCAYFFLRAGELLRLGGNFGLLATNTIAQGDTREVGLDQLTAKDFTIYRAVPSRPWPGTASLEVAHVWLKFGDWKSQRLLDEQPVRRISSALTPLTGITVAELRAALERANTPLVSQEEQWKCVQELIINGILAGQQRAMANAVDGILKAVQRPLIEAAKLHPSIVEVMRPVAEAARLTVNPEVWMRPLIEAANTLPDLREAMIRPILAAITESLSSLSGNTDKPYRLAANADKSFIGSYVLGMGFTMMPEEAQALIAKDTRNKDVLFPYLNGEDLNSRPDQSPSRWVINFFDWPLEKAEAYPDCMAIVQEKVKPERQRTNPDGSYALRKPLPERWWHYGDKRPALYATIAGIKRVLAIPLVSKYLVLAWEPTSIVYSHALGIIATEQNAQYALLQNTIHEEWARFCGSTLETRMRYTPSDCFETFPFPEETGGLEEIGEQYYLHRQGIVQRQQEGLTKTYNRFHDPNERAQDIGTLRELHVEMDRAVAAAYGWSDLDLGHGFHQTKQGTRFTISEAARQEVLGRLLALNHQRYAKEEALGLHAKGGKGAKKGGMSQGRAVQAAETAVHVPGLFDEA